MLAVAAITGILPLLTTEHEAGYGSRPDCPSVLSGRQTDAQRLGWALLIGIPIPLLLGGAVVMRITAMRVARRS